MAERGRDKLPGLSKSRFMAGLQCYKRLYLECFESQLADPVDDGRQAIFDTGTEVGALARMLYPGGALVGHNHLHFDDAIESTNSLLGDRGVPAFFEAAFQHNDVKVRPDVLSRAPSGSFDIIEVKSTTRVKEEHIPDVCVQVYVLEGCGMNVKRACIGHLNKEYVYPGGAYDLRQLFLIEDVTAEVREMLPRVPPLLMDMKRALRSPEPPNIEVGEQCSTPYECPFHGHCHADQPEHGVEELPGAREKLRRSLELAGIKEIRYIHDDFEGLNELQRRARDCVVNNCMFLSKELGRHLAALEYPIHFLDFETFSPALPLFAGTRPYQVIPFQWSNHVLERNGRLRHEQFLHERSDDPRAEFIESLLGTLGKNGSIVAYSHYEATSIRALAVAFPELSGELLGLLDGRMVDLLKLVRKHVYHPEFRGGFSLKTVLPALVPELTYDDLEINDGRMAQVAFAEMRRPETLAERRDFLRDSLLKYCERDTEAMVRLFKELRGA